MPAEKNAWPGRVLDALLLVTTLAAVGVGLWDEAPEWADPVVLLCFFAFFVWRWLISMDRRGYLKENWLDLVLIVLLASPFLRLFSALRVMRILPALRLGAFLRSNRKKILNVVIVSQDSFPTAMALIFGVVFVFGMTSFLLEHAANPQFGQISDGLWWAFVTLTTVGYGDIVPITDAGRIVGVFTMIFGISIYSLMIANLTFFVEEYGRKRHIEEENRKKENAEKKKIGETNAE
ncbi:MAG: potassium channel family protein [Mariprofundaceae bacterium]|nr:potassium channel family protein [Mariprofundaceae bacterium]